PPGAARRAGRPRRDALAVAPAAAPHPRRGGPAAHVTRQAASLCLARACRPGMSVEHTTSVPVRWGDVDAAGIVFYPRFYEWYDLGCEALFAALGLPWPELFPKHGIVGVPILESGSRFASPARYGDTLEIRAEVAWVKDK